MKQHCERRKNQTLIYISKRIQFQTARQQFLLCGAFNTALLVLVTLQPCVRYELLQHCEQKVHIIVDLRRNLYFFDLNK